MAKKRSKGAAGKRTCFRFVKKQANGACPLSWKGLPVKKIEFKKREGFSCAAEFTK